MEAQRKVLAEGGVISKLESAASTKVLQWAIAAPPRASRFLASASSMAKAHGAHLPKLSASGLPSEKELRAHIELFST